MGVGQERFFVRQMRLPRTRRALRRARRCSPLARDKVGVQIINTKRAFSGRMRSVHQCCQPCGGQVTRPPLPNRFHIRGSLGACRCVSCAVFTRWRRLRRDRMGRGVRIGFAPNTLLIPCSRESIRWITANYGDTLLNPQRAIGDWAIRFMRALFD